MKYIKRVKRIVIEGQLILFATDQLRERREFLTKSQGQSQAQSITSWTNIRNNLMIAVRLFPDILLENH